jgi:putative membrane protein insertion efficiency factor
MIRRIALAASLLLAAPAGAGDPMNGPWEAARAGRELRETRPEVAAASAALRLFQRLISPVDGPRCRLYPTCSEFARQAVQRYGLLAGVALTCGRLIRDNASAPAYYRRAVAGGRLVLYDPPEDHWPPGGRRPARRGP